MAVFPRLGAVPLLLVAWYPTVSAGQTRPTTSPGTPLAQLQQRARDEMAKSVADQPALPPAPLSAVADVGRDGDHLRVLTSQRPTAGPSRIEVDGLPGVCTLTVADLTPPDRPPPAPSTRPAVPGSMLFSWFQFDRPGTVVTHTFVEVLPGNIQLSRLIETPGDGGATVLLLERRNVPQVTGNPDPIVYLKVTDPGGAADVYVSADSFGTLCRTQPGPVARYLEPILRDWHVDAAVLPVDRPLEYQVFAADLAVDPATADRVAALVAKLDADDFHDRDAAGEQLRAIGPTAAAVVAQMDPAKFSPEQRARTAALVRQFRPVTDADAARLGGDVDFLLNCLNDTDPFVNRTAVAKLKRITNHDVPFDASLAGQARRDAVWNLRQSLVRPNATTRPT